MDGLIFGGSKNFRDFMEQVESYAATDWPILILGETGVGKELITHFIHRLSSRSRGPLISVNASALPGNLFESELFGYERGAFSGAVNNSKGLIRTAHGGTLFLDEIGEIQAPLQAKLLRTLESGEVRSVGSTRVEHVDARFIAATNVDLYSAVKTGKFRHDLMERISVLRLEVPPLRSRCEDIPLITNHLCQTHGLQIQTDAIELLKAYHWPGNVRQLKNILLRAGAISRNQIRRIHIDNLLDDEQTRFSFPSAPSEQSNLTLADIERNVIETKIAQCQGNKKRAALELGIAKSTLFEKIRRYKSEELLRQAT